MKVKIRIRFCTLCAVCCAVIVLLAAICIPSVPPFTLQSLAVFTVTGIFGTSVGMTSYLLYLFIGAIGLPVFAGLSAGVGVLLGPSGGYLFGFIISIAATGSILNKLGKGYRALILAYGIGYIVLYASSSLFYCTVWLRSYSLSGLISSFTACVVPFILVDTAKLILSAYITRRLDGRIKL